MVVGTVNGDDVGSVDERAEDFALFEIGGDEDIAFQACAGGVGGDGIGEVSGGGAGDHFESEFASPAEGDGNDPVLKGKGGVVYRVIFDIEFANAEGFGQTICFD